MPAKLLLADDSVTIQRVIELTFADEDVQVVAVGDGRQAIERIRTERPDIVLADVGMPERDGYEVSAFVKGDPELAKIPVLLLTGAFEPVDEARARAVGCDGVLVKPFEPQMVISRVRDLLTGRKSTPAPSEPAPFTGPREAPVAPARSGKRTGESIEDYFDRLDAAFATLGPPSEEAATTGEPSHSPEPLSDAPGTAAAPAPAALRPAAAAPSSTAGGIADWDPDLSTAPAPPVPPSATAPAAAKPAPARTPEPTAPGRPVPPAPMPAPVLSPGAPSLTDAFAALLAAEQRQPVAAPVQPATISDEVIDEIVRRVIARMGDESMRRAVLDAAERLVREEIDRIKNR